MRVLPCSCGMPRTAIGAWREDPCDSAMRIQNAIVDNAAFKSGLSFICHPSNTAAFRQPRRLNSNATVHEPMSNDRKFVFLTATGRRRPTWMRVWLIVAAVAAGAVLLWLGLVLALAVLFAAVPVWAWRLFTASRRSEGPAAIEGEYTIITPSVIEVRGEAPDRNPM